MSRENSNRYVVDTLDLGLLKPEVRTLGSLSSFYLDYPLGKLGPTFWLELHSRFTKTFNRKVVGIDIFQERVGVDLKDTVVINHRSPNASEELFQKELVNAVADLDGMGKFQIFSRNNASVLFLLDGACTSFRPNAFLDLSFELESRLNVRVTYIKTFSATVGIEPPLLSSRQEVVFMLHKPRIAPVPYSCQDLASEALVGASFRVCNPDPAEDDELP